MVLNGHPNLWSVKLCPSYTPHFQAGPGLAASGGGPYHIMLYLPAIYFYGDFIIDYHVVSCCIYRYNYF